LNKKIEEVEKSNVFNLRIIVIIMALAFVKNVHAHKTVQHQPSFTFIDLFAGIGGFHTALHQLGGRCVYASEWDTHARTTYTENFKKISPDLFTNDMFRGDITIEENQACIPEDVDILCGGFPCQPFSQAGFKKGFSETRGTLFFEIAKIIQSKRPKAFFLENVRHLFNHDNGKTFEVIRHILEDELGYSVTFQILKASDYGLPTYRPRLYIIGFRKDIIGNNSFEFPNPTPLQFTMSDVFEGDCSKKIGFTLRVGGRGSGIDDRRNWDAYEVDGEIRRITSKEGKKMMGFPENFIFPVSEAQALKQLGNSVAVNPIRATAANMLKILKDNLNEFNCK
jgi:DNA (cytosine-5)-methyltransferase 1